MSSQRNKKSFCTDVKQIHVERDIVSSATKKNPDVVSSLVNNDRIQMRQTNIVLTSLIVAAGVLCITLIGLTLAWRDNRLRTRDLMQTQPKRCCSCQDLKTKPETDEVLKAFERQGPNQTECCGDAGIILDRLLDKVLQERYHSRVSSRYVLDGPCHSDISETPAANLVDIQREDLHIKANIDSYLIMMQNTVPSFVRGGLIYRDGMIEITTSGYYYIYSQLKLQMNSTNTEGPLFNHYVLQESSKAGTLKVILENTETPCETREPSVETTSSVGAVFQLNKNDKVCVTTSNPQYLQRGHSNVFSIQMISKAYA